MKKFFAILLIFPLFLSAQHWENLDSLYGPLPAAVHVYRWEGTLDTIAFRAFYVEAPLRDRSIIFQTDTTKERRLTPDDFFKKNSNPVVVVNGTFFSFQTHQNLNLVIRDGALVSMNHQGSFQHKGKKHFIYPAAIGISRKRKADVAWTSTDSAKAFVLAAQQPAVDSLIMRNRNKGGSNKTAFSKWKMQTAIGGGPVLVQDGKIRITNEEERKFHGKGLTDRHPRTAMGYTADGRLIILAVEGRNPSAAGASLTELAQIMQELGCVEALNLDGGGSSCLLVNGKPTIRPSDKEGQRSIPAVFMIKRR